MPISPDRISQDIETIARFSEVTPDIGYSRPTFTLAWAAARDYVIAEAKKIGCRVWIDAAGNVHAKPASLADDRKVWLSGSHIDSVPTGGKFDGVIGIVAPLEVLRNHPNAPLELIIFAEEEGTTFNLGMLGSRVWAGTLSADDLRKLKNRDGVDSITAGEPYGVDPDRFGSNRLDPDKYIGLIELHAEQGVSLWKSRQGVAVVTAINGRRQYAVKVTGTPNHAGSTKMADRADALCAAAEMVLDLEELGQELAAELDYSVITIGQLFVKPNGINVIPGEVNFTIDFRAASANVLYHGNSRIQESVQAAADRRLGISVEIKETESLPALPMNSGICADLAAAAHALGVENIPMVASGALHDAAILAPLLPTAMLFVASRDGISHNPAEFSDMDHIALATKILAATVTEAE